MIASPVAQEGLRPTKLELRIALEPQRKQESLPLLKVVELGKECTREEGSAIHLFESLLGCSFFWFSAGQHRYISTV